MAETSIVEQTVQTQVQAPVVQEQTVVQEPDLLTRVAQFKLPEEQVVTSSNDNFNFDYKEIEAIKDPVAKEIAMKAYKSMEVGVQKKFQDLAAQRKEADAKLQEAQKLVNQSKSWTPQRIQQELLTNPEFLSAAQMIQGAQAPQERQLTQEEYSALTDSEKQQLAAVPQLKSELLQMKQQAQQEQLLASITQKDVTLRQRFPNYDPLKVNEAAQRFGKLTPADAREYIYKADNFETEVKKAYEYGKLEGQGKLNSKINALSPSGVSTTSNEGLPVRVKGESDQTYFVKLAQFRLAQSRAQK